MEDYSYDEGSGLELVHVSDVLDYLGDSSIIGFDRVSTARGTTR